MVLRNQTHLAPGFFENLLDISFSWKRLVTVGKQPTLDVAGSLEYLSKELRDILTGEIGLGLFGPVFGLMVWIPAHAFNHHRLDDVIVDAVVSSTEFGHIRWIEVSQVGLHFRQELTHILVVRLAGRAFKNHLIQATYHLREAAFKHLGGIAAIGDFRCSKLREPSTSRKHGTAQGSQCDVFLESLQRIDVLTNFIDGLMDAFLPEFSFVMLLHEVASLFIRLDQGFDFLLGNLRTLVDDCRTDDMM